MVNKRRMYLNRIGSLFGLPLEEFDAKDLAALKEQIRKAGMLSAVELRKLYAIERKYKEQKHLKAKLRKANHVIRVSQIQTDLQQLPGQKWWPIVRISPEVSGVVA